MIDFCAADRLISKGYAAICCMCERFWEHRNEAGDPYCGRVDCGGPIKMRAFPFYKGPWPNKVSFCFFCGGPSDASVEIGRHGMLGVCDEHVEYMKKMLSSSGRDVLIREEDVNVL